MIPFFISSVGNVSPDQSQGGEMLLTGYLEEILSVYNLCQPHGHHHYGCIYSTDVPIEVLRLHFP